MLNAKVILLILVLVSLTGCGAVVSLHPLAIPNGNDTVFDPALVGTWEEVKAEPDGTKDRYIVDRAESGYSVKAVASVTSGREPGQTPGPPETMHLMKVGNRLLLDVYCPSDSALPPVHLFLRLRLEKDTAWVSGMDSSWLQDQIEASGLPRHEVLADDWNRMVLTASSAELRRHLLPYVSDNKSFSEETELHRVK